MKFAAELEASLREFASAGAAELCENGGRLAPRSKLSWEVRGSDDKPCYTSGRNNTTLPAGLLR